MALYFYCAGDAQATNQTVTCSVPMQSYTPDHGFSVAEAVDTYSPFVFMFFAIIFGTAMIKKAIEN